MKEELARFIDDLNYGLSAFGVQLPHRVPNVLDMLDANPGRSTALVVAITGALFWLAEREHNPKVKDIGDAMIYTSTCLTVGYSEIHAQTAAGKAIGTVLMTYGPALATKALDRPATDTLPSADDAQQQILATLKEILERMPVNVGAPPQSIE